MTHRQNFFDYALPTEGVRKTITGKSEFLMDEILRSLEYKVNLDYFKQYPIESTYVADFAFPEERLLIEVDGDSHRGKHQRRADIVRDVFCCMNGWFVLRVDWEELRSRPSFYKYIIQDWVEEKRNEAGFSA